MVVIVLISMVSLIIIRISLINIEQNKRSLTFYSHIGDNHIILQYYNVTFLHS